MRRNEFQITDQKHHDKILASCDFGQLAMVDKGNQPYQIPLNYLHHENSIFFHSSVTGKKIDCLQVNSEVVFSVLVPLSLIPSYFTDPNQACNATQFFLSLSVKGKAEFITDPSQKQRVMTAMMQRLQPEGGHRPISEKQVKGMALIELPTEGITAKFKLGQNLSPEKFEVLIKKLEERGSELDLQTVYWMKEFYPN